MDEAENISIKVKVHICVRSIENNLETQELFPRFFNSADTKAATPFGALNDILCRFNLTIDNCRGKCYNGAVNMRAQHCGLQALLQQKEPRALYVLFGAHP